jgi:hypothetical protein
MDLQPIVQVVCCVGSVCLGAVLLAVFVVVRFGFSVITDLISGGRALNEKTDTYADRPSFQRLGGALGAQAASPAAQFSFEEALARRQQERFGTSSVVPPAGYAPAAGMPPMSAQQMPGQPVWPPAQPGLPPMLPGHNPAQIQRPSLTPGVPYQPPAFQPPAPPFQAPQAFPPRPRLGGMPGPGQEPLPPDRAQRRRQNDDRYEIYDDGDLGGGLDMLGG